MCMCVCAGIRGLCDLDSDSVSDLSVGVPLAESSAVVAPADDAEAVLNRWQCAKFVADYLLV